MKAIYLTKKLLKEKQACFYWENIFDNLFPSGEVNVADKKVQDKCT